MMTEILLIAAAPELKSVCQIMTEDFGYRIAEFETLDALLKASSNIKEPKVVILSVVEALNETDIVREVGNVHELFPEAFILCITRSSLDAASSELIRKSGCNALLLKEEALHSSKVHFICSHVISSTYIPIKTSELTVGAQLTFDLYHLLPLRGKFLPSKRKGEILSAEMIQKASSVGEMYIKRTETEAFREYTAKNTDASAAGLTRRCRAQFVSLSSSFQELLFHLSDQSEFTSYTRGQELFQKTMEIGDSMLESLAGLEDGWSIINNSSIEMFGSVERTPAIAAYASIFAVKARIEELDDVLIAALLSDLGLLFLSPEITRKIRQGKISELTPDERQKYELHPMRSIEIALVRKLPLHKEVRHIIECTHERVDGSGFPKQRDGIRVPKIAELIQLSELIDQNTRIKLGHERKDLRAYIKGFLQEELPKSRFRKELVASIQIS